MIRRVSVHTGPVALFVVFDGILSIKKDLNTDGGG